MDKLAFVESLGCRASFVGTEQDSRLGSQSAAPRSSSVELLSYRSYLTVKEQF